MALEKEWEGIKKDEMLGLPESVKKALKEHLELYQRDPEAGHMWDPIVIGVPGGPVPNLLMTYTGRKSGRTLQTVLQYYTLDNKIAVVASRGGTVDHPVWYLNLVAQPQCEIQIGKNARKATARTVHGAERARWWDSITKEQPVQLEYQARTSREIPIVVFD